jgi:4,5-DOPA dioxygenase extradiol
MSPSLFLSHGAPTLPLTASPARDFLAGLGRALGRPSAIVVASAHWETDVPTISNPARNGTIHDFHGFPKALYDLRYEPPGAPGTVAAAAGLLRDAGLPCRVDTVRGLDHGAWVPLLLMYPEADIPVMQVSVQTRQGPALAFRVGQALAALRRQDVLVIGSGSFTHDLGRFRGGPADAPAPPDVTAFADWLDAAITGGRTADLLDYRRLAPFAARQHPTEEHLLPLFTAMGAGGAARRLHASAMYSILRMDAYAFE